MFFGQSVYLSSYSVLVFALFTIIHLAVKEKYFLFRVIHNFRLVASGPSLLASILPPFGIFIAFPFALPLLVTIASPS